MSKEGVSETAFFIARARELEKKQENPLFEDKFAHLFLDEEKNNQAEQLLKIIPESINVVRFRTKYFNDKLQHLIKTQGVKQILILGAGLDMRPYIFANQGIEYFELDQEVIIDYKTQVLNKNNISLKSKMIKCNYFKQDLIQILTQKKFDFLKETFIIWEGNSMYLPKEFVEKLFLKLKENFNKFIISFDYFDEKLILRKTGIKEIEEFSDFFKNMNSPYINGYNDVNKELLSKFKLELESNF